MRELDWASALSVWADVGTLDAQAALDVRLCRNLLAIERWRPGLHEILCEAWLRGVERPLESRYAIATHPAGLATVVWRASPENPWVPLSPGADPRETLRLGVGPLSSDTDFQTGLPVALCGIGDGYVLRKLASEPLALSPGKERALYVCEPDPEAVLATLRIHDYAAPRGPIEQERVLWFVGAGWSEAFMGALQAQPWLHPPAKRVEQGPESAAIARKIQDATDRIEAHGQELEDEVARLYAGSPRESLPRLLDDPAGKSPRVLLVTSRFTTVLQFAADEAARALALAGWAARVIKEPRAHHAPTRRAISAAILEFEPDAVLLINFTRADYGSLFPREVPVVTWVQDHQDNLLSARAGSSVGERDFLLCPWAETLVEQFGYPRAHCRPLRRLTRARPPLRRGERILHDLAYVSNHSASFERRAREFHEWVPLPSVERALVGECCERMNALYASGGSLRYPSEIDALLAEVERARDRTIEGEGVRARVVIHLFDRVNNVLYRQQALRWTARVSETLGLDLAIYGRGWESHPEFARYARGHVDHGEALDRVVAGSRISLALEPYFTTGHPRFLDGISAGGFFLVRRFEPAPASSEWLELLEHAVDPGIASFADARARLAPEILRRLEAADAALPPREGDRITAFREFMASHPWHAFHLFPPPPRYTEILFGDAEEMEERVRRYLEDPDSRLEIQEAQREFVQRHFTYEVEMPRAFSWVARTLAAADSPERVSP